MTYPVDFRKICRRLSPTAGLLLFLLHPTAFPNTGVTYQVAIINSSDTSIYQNVSEIIINTVHKKLADKTRVNFEMISVRELNTVEDASLRKADLILAVGQKATEMAFQLGFQLNNDKPILSTLVLSQAYRNALAKKKNNRQNTSRSAIFLDNPPLRQIILARILLGKIHRIGVLTSDFSRDDIVNLEKTMHYFDIELQTEHIGSRDNLVRKLSYLLRDSNMLLAIPDPAVLNRATARNILLTTYRHRIPVIGFSESYVKAGALAAVFSSPEQVAIQTGETLAQIIVSDQIVLPKSAYPHYFSVAVNNSVAKSLNIQLQRPDDLRNEIQHLLKKIEQNK